MNDAKCKICRRLGAKLFLKGEKCMTPKCLMIKKPYPSTSGKRRRRSISEFGKELREKQKMKNWYNLREKQFSKYVHEVLGKRGKVDDAGTLLIRKLETRLDNIIFRIGLAPSRSQSRQLAGHGHFMVNGKRTDIPSRQLKKGDVLQLRPGSTQKTVFKNVLPLFKKNKPPSWIDVNIEKGQAKIIGDPSLEEASPPAEISAIFEYYSR